MTLALPMPVTITLSHEDAQWLLDYLRDKKESWWRPKEDNRKAFEMFRCSLQKKK